MDDSFRNNIVSCFDTPEDNQKRRMVNQMFLRKLPELDRYFKERHITHIAEESVQQFINSHSMININKEEAIAAYSRAWKTEDNEIKGYDFWTIECGHVHQYQNGSILFDITKEAIEDCHRYKNNKLTHRSIDLFGDEDEQVDPELYLQEYFTLMKQYGINPLI